MKHTGKLGAIIAVIGLVATALFLTGCDNGSTSDPTYTVTFNSNGGTAVAQVIGLTSGSTITAPADPTKTGYTCIFDGWYKDNTTFANPWNFGDGGDTVTANITLYAKWVAYSLGDTGPGGGKIFFVDPTGFTVEGYTGATGSFVSYTAYYLEAAPADEGSSIKWSDDTTAISNVTTFTSNSDSKASQIGNGRKDTRIINDYLNGEGENGTAAQKCAIKTVTVGSTTFNDWFLPSLGELNELYKAKGEPNVPTTGYFWSSSQYASNYAWFQIFASGFQGDFGKANEYSVRAIRAF